MYFYVKFEGRVRIISNITVDDDCAPVVEGRVISDSPRGEGEGGGGSSRSTVDAISWFKSLPLEAVYLDCNSRDARWCLRVVKVEQSNGPEQNEHSQSPKVSVHLRKAPQRKVHIDETGVRFMDGEQPFIPENARRLFLEHPGVVDFNPLIDEMFERAEELVRKWDHLRNSGQLFSEVAQILHCYVFPAVCFQKEDAPVLKECLRLVSLRQETIERDITAAEKKIIATEKYLTKQKEAVLSCEDLSTQMYLQACGTRFVESFYIHITKDIQKKNAVLESVQIKMNELRKVGGSKKKMMSDSERKTGGASVTEMQSNSEEKTPCDLGRQKQKNSGKKMQDDMKKKMPGSSQAKTQGDTEKKTQGGTEKRTQGDSEKKTQDKTEKNTHSDTDKSTQWDTEKKTQGDTEKKTQGETEKTTQGETEKKTQYGDRIENKAQSDTETEMQGDHLEELEKLKQERDTIHELVQKLIVLREAIRNHLYRPFIPKKKKRRGPKVVLSKKDASLHADFLEVHKQLVEHKDTLKKLCLRKLHISSMREAIVSTLKMVSVENGTLRGMGDMSEFSIYLGSEWTKREHWQSMQAKVDKWMMDADCALYSEHMEGCQLVRDLADGILGDIQVSSLGLNDSHETGAGVQAGRVGRRDSDTDPSYQRAPMVKVMRDQVRVHTWEIAENIVNLMGFQIIPGSRHINRAWVCYGPHFWRQAGEAVERIYTHFHAPRARRVYSVLLSVAIPDLMDSNFFRDFCTKRLSATSYLSEASQMESAIKFQPSDAVSAISLDLMRCSVSELYARANRDGARMNYEMLTLESLSGSLDDESILQSRMSNEYTMVDVDNIAGSSFTPQAGNANTDHLEKPELPRSNESSASDSGTSINTDDLFDMDCDDAAALPSQDLDLQRSISQTETVSSSQRLASMLSLFEVVVEPYQELVRGVMEAPDIMGKLRAVWKSVDFLSQKAGEICLARGMDTLLPLSIFATASFPEELFISYYVQLLILTDLKPPFTFHSIYDFSLTNAISSYMYLFHANLPSPPAVSSDESE